MSKSYLRARPQRSAKRDNPELADIGASIPNKPKGRKGKRRRKASQPYEPGSGVIPWGRLMGKTISKISLGQLSAIHGAAIRKGPKTFLNDVREEMSRRKTMQPETLSPLPTTGVIRWGHCRGQQIADQYDEALAGAVWAAKRGIGDEAYLAELKGEQTRRACSPAGPVDAEFESIARSF